MYILQIAEILRGGNFPIALKNFLLNPNILKVGHNIGSDLKRLQHEANIETPFSNFLDVARLAKARGVIKTATISLAELAAIVLKLQMNKDQDICVSTQWDVKDLSEEQKEYVALDAYASLAIYERLQDVPEPGDISAEPLPGLSVSVYQEDGHTLIAYGRWSSANLNFKVGNINITKTRAAVDIIKVVVRGVILRLHERSLESFGQPPFTIVCKRNQLQTSSLELEPDGDCDYATILSQASAEYQARQSGEITTEEEASQPTNVVIESWLRHLEGMEEADILNEIKSACVNDEA